MAGRLTQQHQLNATSMNASNRATSCLIELLTCACMSAMQEAQLGSSMQLQKHVAVVEAMQPALVTVVVEPGLKHLMT